MINIEAKRWFDKKNGNTYHSVMVSEDGEIIGVVDFEYGYGDHYKQTAHQILQDAGIYPTTKRTLKSGMSTDDYEFMMDARDKSKFSFHVYDVTRKKDLAFTHQRNNPARFKDANEDAARELGFYIENDGDLYRQSFIPIVYNLQKKIKKGTFDLEKSISMWMFLVDAGAKKYTKEHGSPGDEWNGLFNKSTRLLVAKELAESFIAEINAGNFWKER